MITDQKSAPSSASHAADDQTPSPGGTRPLRRRREGRMLAGVAGGIAEHYGIDVTIVRIAFVALAVVGGGGMLLYVAAWLLIPEEGSEVSIAGDLTRGRGH